MKVWVTSWLSVMLMCSYQLKVLQVAAAVSPVELWRMVRLSTRALSQPSTVV